MSQFLAFSGCGAPTGSVKLSTTSTNEPVDPGWLTQPMLSWASLARTSPYAQSPMLLNPALPSMTRAMASLPRQRREVLVDVIEHPGIGFCGVSDSLVVPGGLARNSAL